MISFKNDKYNDIMDHGIFMKCLRNLFNQFLNYYKISHKHDFRVSRHIHLLPAGESSKQK